jgi:small subunit ribosomal protein S14
VAKISRVIHNNKRKAVVDRYRTKRQELRDIIKSPKYSFEDKMEARRKMDNLPRMSIETRIRNRCEVTGRSRGFYRKFKMSRLSFRQLASNGLIPGVTKASW